MLVEYGEMVFDLALNFLVLAANDALGQQPPQGLVETAPGFRSMLVSYDPFALASSELVDHLRAVHDPSIRSAGSRSPAASSTCRSRSTTRRRRRASSAM